MASSESDPGAMVPGNPPGSRGTTPHGPGYDQASRQGSPAGESARTEASAARAHPEAATGSRRRWQPFLFERGSASAPRGRSRDMAGRDAFQALFAEPFRMMQEIMRNTLGPGGGTDRWFGDFRSAQLHPQVDVVDTGESVTVAAELPGVAREDLEVMVEGDALVLRGEKRHEFEGREEGCYHLERTFGHFERRIPLPEDVDPGEAQATFENAVLCVRFPKTRQPRRARHIEVR